MKVLFDIYHLPQFNFFKNALEALHQEVDLQLCTLRRGRQVEVIQNDCPNLPLTVFGNYAKNQGSVSFILKVILPRLYRLWRWMRQEKFQLVVTANYQANIIARLMGIPSVGFNDDPEKINLRILKLVAEEVYLPIFAKPKGKTRVFKALKEWAYLAPQYFSPNLEALTPYQLNAKQYFFIREVSTKSLNYRKQQSDSVLSFAHQLPADFPVLLSLEDKSMKDRYPKDWIILQEPVADIHSLMYYSHSVISSGDSMAREAAMLGVPGIYCGIRDMAANRVMIEKQMLFKVSPMQVPEFVKHLVSGTASQPIITQDEFRAQLACQWDDITRLILDIVARYQNDLSNHKE
jgi:uncharacterized protein